MVRLLLSFLVFFTFSQVIAGGSSAVDSTASGAEATTTHLSMTGAAPAHEDSGKVAAAASPAAARFPVAASPYTSCTFVRSTGEDPKSEADKMRRFRNDLHDIIEGRAVTQKGAPIPSLVDVLMGGNSEEPMSKADAERLSKIAILVVDSIIDAQPEAPKQYKHMKLAHHTQRGSCYLTNIHSMNAARDDKAGINVDDVLQYITNLATTHLGTHFGFDEERSSQLMAALDKQIKELKASTAATATAASGEAGSSAAVKLEAAEDRAGSPGSSTPVVGASAPSAAAPAVAEPPSAPQTCPFGGGAAPVAIQGVLPAVLSAAATAAAASSERGSAASLPAAGAGAAGSETVRKEVVGAVVGAGSEAHGGMSAPSEK